MLSLLLSSIPAFGQGDYTIGGGLDPDDPDVANQFGEPFTALATAEYFVGADPGEGNGTTLSLGEGASMATALEELSVPIDELTAGTHDVGVRVRDEAGRWSNPLIRRFTVSTFTIGGGVDPSDPDVGSRFATPFKPLATAEYFVGEDPGEGNGVPLPLAGESFLSMDLGSLSVPVDALPAGTHEVGVRVRDAAGRWSNPLLRRFNLYRQDVGATQREGAKLVDLDYDLLYGSEPYTVTVLISADGGKTWSVSTASVTGDVGSGVMPGPGRRIVWHAGEDWNGDFSEEMHFRVIAYRTSQVVPSGFVAVDPGQFVMGSPVGELGRDPAEIERAVVMAEPFLLATNEVSWSEWNSVRDQGPAHGYTDIAAGQNGAGGDAGGNHPVTQVSWLDVVKWCNLKSEIEGRRPVYYAGPAFTPDNIIREGIPEVHVYWNADGYRLPSEAEWEFACRAGTQTAFHGGEISDVITDPVLDASDWYAANSGGGTHPVGSKPGNPLGIFDLHGNVREWCWDGHAAYEEGPQWDPTWDEGSFRVIRGGSWDLDAAACRSAARGLGGRNSRAPDLGFRLALNHAGLSVISTETGAVIDSRDPQAGNLLGGLRPSVAGEVYCLALQPDGRLLVGGDFSAIDGVPRSHLARLNADGSLDESFAPDPDFTVYAVAVQGDGGILVAGDFASIAGGAADYLARLHPDGSFDPGFQPVVDFTVRALALQADGRILIGGDFFSVGGWARTSLARLEADGSLDLSFDAGDIDFTVNTIAVQDDGRILIGGAFTSVNWTPRYYLARLEEDGTLDPNFDPEADGIVTSIAVQPNRRIVVAGEFTSIGGQYRSYLARLTPTGLVDIGFAPDPDGSVRSIALQADGQMIVGGEFYTIGGVNQERLARLEPTGGVDATFAPVVDGPVHSIALLADGRVCVGGAFTAFGLVSRNGMAWLDNHAATGALTALNATRVRWLRGGSGPVCSGVDFELSTDGGATWLPIGEGRRISGGWELIGGNLPESGRVRARGRVVSGESSASSGLLIEEADFSGLVPLPEIELTGGSVESIEDGDSISCGTLAVGAGRDLHFTIHNLGYGDLTGISVTIDGANAPDFQVIRAPDPEIPGPGGTSELVVRFTPSDIGPRSAAVHIANNDLNERPYDLNLDGVGVIAGALGSSHTGGFNGEVLAIAVQPDGKTVVAGDFTVAGGQDRNRVARLLEDGTVESATGFAAGSGVNGPVRSVLIQPDGGIVLGGSFTSVSSQLRNGLARLLPDGVVEPTATFNTGTGANGEVRAMALQPDGKIVAVGDFTEVNGKARGGIVRLLPDGTVEESPAFDVGLGANGAVRTVALQVDGAIVIGGDFTAVDGEPRSHLARLNPDGSLDATFDPGADGAVEVVTIDGLGRLVIGGSFNTLGGVACPGIARLSSAGVVETSDRFDPGGGPDGPVRGIVHQADGGILVVGEFGRWSGSVRGGVARLYPNGTLETSVTFETGAGANGPVSALALRQDGGVLVGGGFSSFDGEVRNRFAALYNGQPDEWLEVVDARRIGWQRGGTVPELEDVRFDLLSEDGLDWVPLESPVVRTEEGWEIDSLMLPSVGWVRATGRTRSGSAAGSAGRIEQQVGFLNEPVLATLNPEEVTANTANLRAAVNPNGNATVWFEYGPGESFGSRTAEVELSGGEEQEVQISASGLVGSSTYSVRIVASTEGGTYRGNTVSFTTADEPPVVSTGNPIFVTGTRVQLVGAVNPRGRETTVHFEYGATTLYTESTPPQVLPPGTTTIEVFSPDIVLVSGQPYHCRIVATSSGGTAYGADVSFVAEGGGSATAPPSVVTRSVGNLGTTTATLTGEVNPNGGITDAYFEYGTTPEYGRKSPVFGAGNGSDFSAIYCLLPDLLPGTTYHYRLVASNHLGQRKGADLSFTTAFLPPTVETGRAAASSTTSVLVDGLVWTNGAPSTASFEFGPQGEGFTGSVVAQPAELAGEGGIPAQAELPNLLQGVTYEYRLRASNSGGTGFGESGTFTVAILSGLDQRFPQAPPSTSNMLTVNIEPAGIGSGWRFVGERQWRPPGSTASLLAAGDRAIEYRPANGYVHPLRETVSVVDGVPVSLDRAYFETDEAATGSLTVLLEPAGVADPGLPAEDRAQWRFLGDGDGEWRDSAGTVTGLPAGDYLIECKPVDGRATPPVSAVRVEPDDGGSGNLLTLTYFLDPPTVGAPAEPVPFTTVSTDAALPHAFVGQIRSDVGLSSSFAVKRRVVATAAHVVFDDGTLSTATGLQWLFQRDKDAFEPVPMVPRGFYIFDGYAAQREADASPGASSPESQNLDVAAMYFTGDAARGGYSGFLASDLDNNEFLLSSANMILSGYPVDGVPGSALGRMHATPAGPVVFTRGFGRTFATDDLQGVGGMSGGPLCVQHENGAYYPAAIYLGGTNQTVVRAIDSDVIDLFNRAETSGDGGDNNVGGGITHTSVVTLGSPGQPGALRVLIEPQAARDAGAGWGLLPEVPQRLSGTQRTRLAPGTYKLAFSSIDGFDPPEVQSVGIEGGQLATITYRYASEEVDDRDAWRQRYFETTEAVGDAADDADPDGDGSDNGDEYVAGTDPTDGSDFFRITSAVRVEEGFAVSFAAKAGRLYELQRRQDLGAGAWITVGSTGLMDAEGQGSLTDPDPPSDRAFYQVFVTLP